MPDTLLLVEDNEDILANLYAYLEPLGYELDCARNGRAGLAMALERRFDCLILDVMLPGMDGLALCRALREEHGQTLPVLMLTARDTVADRVLGLEAGADDYLVKPFDFAELLARIRAMTRKSTGSVTNVFTCGDLSLDAASHRVTRAGKSIDLSAKEFAVLEFMIRNKGSVLSREAIENNVWSYDWEGGTNVVDVYMSYLRRKLDADFDKKLIHTVRGVGWVLRDEA